MPLVKPNTSLLGVGVYTPAEAQRLIGVKASRIVRWLRGHSVRGTLYHPLWTSQITLDHDELYLGFRDLVQTRVAAALVAQGLSPQKVRRAILLATDILSDDHPFASARFRSDGTRLLLQVLVSGEDDRLIDLFSGGQYVMRTVIEPSLKGVEFDGDAAASWWPDGRRAGIVLDPQRQFGQPIEAASGVPTQVLAKAVEVEGSIERASRMYMVAPSAVRRAMSFERRLAA